MPKRDEQLSLIDLWTAIKQHRFIATGIVGCFLVLATWFSLTSPVTYFAEATFRDKGTSKSELDSSFFSFIGVSSSNPENEAKATFTSKKLIGETIQELGLQATISEHRSRFSRYLRNIKENLLTEMALLMRKQERVHLDVPEPLRTAAVVYGGEEPFSVSVVFHDEERYQVRKGKKVLAEGNIGLPCVFSEAEVTLVRCGEGKLAKRRFDLTFFSLNKKATDFQKALSIRTDKKKDIRLLQLSFSYPDRHQAVAFLNTLMDQYQHYLHDKHQKQMVAQLGYLEERRSQNRSELNDLMDEYAQSLTMGIDQSGFTQTKEEISFLSACQQKYRDKLMANDLDLLRLEQAKSGKNLPFGTSVLASELVTEIRRLQKQRDDLECGLGWESSADNLLEQWSLWRHLHEKLAQCQQLHRQIDQNNAVSLEHHSLLEDDPILRFCFEEITDPLRRERAQHHLERLMRLMSVEEKTVQDRLTFQQKASNQFQGLTLEAAQALSVELTKQERTTEAEAKKYALLKASMDDPSFEIPSLSALLNDPVVQSTVVETKKLLVTLQDDGYRSAKEQDRLKQEIDLQRHFLQQHLAQTQQLLEQQQLVFQEQQHALQQKMVDLINQQISIMESHLDDFLLTRMQELREEKGVLDGYLAQVQKAMRDLPKKSVQEQILQEELQSREKVVEELAKTVEMKNIALHLEMVDSAPVDLAVAALHPRSPRLIFYLFLGAFVGGLAFFGFLFQNLVEKGMPVTPTLLAERGFFVAGMFHTSRGALTDPLHPNDLAVLRRVASQLTRTPSTLLIEGEGPHYAQALAHLLHRRGLRVLLLDCTFRSDVPQDPKEEPFGMSCSWKEQGLFGWETVTEESLNAFAEEIGSFDLILGYTSALPTSAEAEALTSAFSKTAVTLHQERLPELAYFFQKPSEQLLFLY